MATHIAIDYIEFSVTDMPRAKAFYTQALGWHFTDYGPEYAGIHSAQGGDQEMGGLSVVESVAQGGPLIVLRANQDLEQSLQQVEAAGAKITKAPFSFPGGRRFEFEDPDGNALAVWAKD